MWFKIRVAIFVLFVFMVLVGALYLCFMYYIIRSNNAGSVEEAVKLKNIIEPITIPESGVGCDPDYAYHRFDNGEWVMGIGRNSHGSSVGGTVVLKDSRGQVRFFVGHVCGPSGHMTLVDFTANLDEFYKSLVTGFIEQPLS
jgi:hypothetical protein